MRRGFCAQNTKIDVYVTALDKNATVHQLQVYKNSKYIDRLPLHYTLFAIFFLVRGIKTKQ